MPKIHSYTRFATMCEISLFDVRTGTTFLPSDREVRRELLDLRERVLSRIATSYPSTPSHIQLKPLLSMSLSNPPEVVGQRTLGRIQKDT